MIESEFHFNDLPHDILVELEPNFCEELCTTVVKMNAHKSKSSLGKILDIKGWKARKLWNRKNRFSISWLEKLRSLCYPQDPTKFSVENVDKNIISVGTHADKRIYNPKFPFMLPDLVYVYAHLIFDGSARLKGTYFMAPEKELLEYHRNRLQNFGRVETNFIENDKQLYIPWGIAHIVKEIFNVNSFKSLEATIPFELKKTSIENKEIANEIIKSAIIDDGWVEDKISFSVSNEQLSRDVWEIAKAHYNVGKFPAKPRIRIGISGKDSIEWKWSILSSSLTEFQKNIKLPLSHKQERIDFAVKRQQREWYKRRPMETKKLIVKSLSEKPKSIKELSFELNVRTTSVLNLINGIHCPSQDTTGLKELGIVGILEYRTNTPGERTGKFPIFCIKDKETATKFLES